MKKWDKNNKCTHIIIIIIIIITKYIYIAQDRTVLKMR